MRVKEFAGLRVRQTVIAVAGASLLACGGGSEPPAPPPTPPISISTTPGFLSLFVGSSGFVIATLVRGGGYTADVTLSLSGAPAGVAIALSATTLTGGTLTSNVLATVTPGTVAGTYPITISASGANATTATATFPLTVTSVVGGTAVSLSYCGADAPVWLAYQDGTGPWTRLAPNAGTSTYQFNAASTRVGVAAVDTVGTGYALRVTYATPAEFNGFTGASRFTGCASKRVNGTIVNSTPGQLVNVSLGETTKFASSGSGVVSFTLDSVAAGSLDLVATRVQSNRRIDKMILRRAQDIANNGSLAQLDFNSAESFAAGSANVTIAGLGADTAFVTTIFQGVRGNTFGFLTTRTGYTNASGAVGYDALPLDRLGANDLQQLYAVTTSTTQQRFTNVFFRGPVDRTLTMGPVLTAPTIARLPGGAYSRVSTQLALQTDYNRYTSADFVQATLNRTASVVMTGGYSAGASTWDLTIPDLSAATGWAATWGLQNGTPISWSVTGLGGAIFLLDPAIVDGALSRSARAIGAAPLP
jgi:hypothetical protein